MDIDTHNNCRRTNCCGFPFSPRLMEPKAPQYFTPRTETMKSFFKDPPKSVRDSCRCGGH